MSQVIKDRQPPFFSSGGSVAAAAAAALAISADWLRIGAGASSNLQRESAAMILTLAPAFCGKSSPFFAGSSALAGLLGSLVSLRRLARDFG